MKLLQINFNKPDKIIFVTLFFISLLLFLHYVNANAYDNYWDEWGNIDGSQEILENGFEFEAGKETYPYLVILSGLRVISNDDIVIMKILMSVLQYVVYLGTVIFIANYACSFTKSKRKSLFLDFIDPKKGKKHYIDRYNNEPKYKSWFNK